MTYINYLNNGYNGFFTKCKSFALSPYSTVFALGQTITEAVILNQIKSRIIPAEKEALLVEMRDNPARTYNENMYQQTRLSNIELWENNPRLHPIATQFNPYGPYWKASIMCYLVCLILTIIPVLPALTIATTLLAGSAAVLAGLSMAITYPVANLMDCVENSSNPSMNR